MPDGDNFVSNRAPPCPKCGADNPSIGVDWDPQGVVLSLVVHRMRSQMENK